MMQQKIILPKRRKDSIFNRNSPLFVARLSFLVSVLIALMTFLLGWLEDSLFYKANGLIALTDIVNSAILLTAVAHSNREPDSFFNYGYGKYESFGIFVSSSLITLITIYTIYEAVVSFGKIVPIGNFTYLILFSLVSASLMFWMHKTLLRYYNNFQLPILRYDAEVWKYDSIIEIGVILTLFLCVILDKLGFTSAARIADSVSAIIFVAIAMRIPIKFGKKSIDQLLDRTMPEKFHYDILSVIAENFKNICEFRNIYARQSGKDIFVEIDVVLPYDFTLAEAYEIEKKITNEIRTMYSNAIPRIYVVPCSKDCIYDNINHCPVKKWKKELGNL
ncbi:cation diffusion facilitator family transporter [Bacteroidetes/Chlorobi group bacterium Naka2016]|jgi:cation diffusion facilitator family transporter|nr:MAG: cation diffusion facilitator family transporter [Bacteroidetes/Chlorobi group bacterium Naka2016]